ncbi:MAG: serine/threonine protein kinase [Fibrobacteres bacterium]|nr:serine/threonine protein kinase [Fibrobacterota bacterium]
MIGKGGMGEVWSARDSRLNRKVAIKRILAKYMKSSTVLHRFLRESALHRAAVPLQHRADLRAGAGRNGHLHRDGIRGWQLRAGAPAPEGPYSVAEIIPILSQMCDALTMAHDRGIIHRDIKPANILLTSGGVPKLVDFGLAHEPESDSTAIGSVLGTVDFMAPEQRVSATNVDGRADVFGLAATAYQMLTGERPRHLYPERIPIELRATMLLALEEHPDRRIPSAAEFKRRLTVLESTTESSGEKGGVSALREVQSAHLPFLRHLREFPGDQSHPAGAGRNDGRDQPGRDQRAAVGMGFPSIGRFDRKRLSVSWEAPRTGSETSAGPLRAGMRPCGASGAWGTGTSCGSIHGASVLNCPDRCAGWTQDWVGLLRCPRFAGSRRGGGNPVRRCLLGVRWFRGLGSRKHRSQMNRPKHPARTRTIPCGPRFGSMDVFRPYRGR